ncbi:unnamed protein product [Polarella glacialis]|uniref:Uncharacterized protein n=1 Tax=Polarella glacialis TaxID=89957 RepID=A0A813GNW0_POLGL|nr:unnamed protein product [Polarella glacialis]
MGVVRKLLSGEKGERIAAAAAAALAARSGQVDASGPDGSPALAPSLKRVLWRSSPIDKARRDGQLASLERAVLPLLAARLPAGAEALGVCSSQDGTSLRMFVRLSAADGDVAQRAAAAAAAVGALLGCETEVLACGPAAAPAAESTAPPLVAVDSKAEVEAEKAAASLKKKPKKGTKGKTKKAKKKPKEVKTAKKKKAGGKKQSASGSSSSESSSDSSESSD